MKGKTEGLTQKSHRDNSIYEKKEGRKGRRLNSFKFVRHSNVRFESVEIIWTLLL